VSATASRSTSTSAPKTDDPLETTHHVAIGGDALSMIDRQWLITNGTGAYAMGTLPGINTNRYHGLFVAATAPPVGRVMVLNQTFEQLLIGDEMIEWGSHEFLDEAGERCHAPRGHRDLADFKRGITCRWTHQNGPVRLTRTLQMHWKKQAMTLEYVIEGVEAPAVMKISPFLTLRDYHSVLDHREAGAIDVREDGDTIRATRGDVTATLQCPGATFVADPKWWFGVRYRIDADRGQTDSEDLFVPGAFNIDLPARKKTRLTLTAALGDEPAGKPASRKQHLQTIFDHLSVEEGDEHDRVRGALAIASDDFVVDRTIGGKRLSTILAGYPWFADWGRDALIALDGLLLCTGRYDEAKATLRTFAGSLKDGLVPNRFDDYATDAAHYNTVDASLWFVHAALRYVEVTGDEASWGDWLGDAAIAVIEGYINGTPDDMIKMGGDCLILAGHHGTQLTWMDAACNGVVFTPRPGKAVEINALWHHNLASLAVALKKTHPQKADHFKKLAGRAKRAFNRTFWSDELGYCHDHVFVDGEGNEHPDTTLRPNQVIAAALDPSPLALTKRKKILKAIDEHLLTPYGLRTLPPGDPNYHGEYHGPQPQRDEAYHQGTAWPWLTGYHVEGLIRANRATKKSIDEARDAVRGLLNFLLTHELGQLHEIHEADSPHRPVGCPAQAWSVAELIRSIDLIDNPPETKSKSKSKK